LNRENIIINSTHNNYETKTWIGQPTEYFLRSITVEFQKKGDYIFTGNCTIYTNKSLSEDETKDKIIEVING